MSNLPTRVKQTWANIRQLSHEERLILAKLLLDSIVTPEADEEADWQQLSLAAFEAEWDNPDDAVYDNWRELYDVPAGYRTNAHCPSCRLALCP